MTIEGSCLCGDVRLVLDGPLEWATHCHCSRCRKTHGAAFATLGACDVGALRIAHGEDRIARFQSSPGLSRTFCRGCGSVVPDTSAPWNGKVFVPLGLLDGDPGTRPVGHIFVGSKAPWYEIRDALPAFDAYPPGIDTPVLPDLEPRLPNGTSGGSCLCGEVAFSVEGTALRCHHCHCSRCRRARAAAFATNFAVPIDTVRLLRGESLLDTYQLPGARFFAQVFCRRCGAKMPRLERERPIALVPLASLDDDPGIRPESHIFVGSKAPWDEITDDLPQFETRPPV